MTAMLTEKQVEILSAIIEHEEMMSRIDPDYKKIMIDATFWPRVLTFDKTRPEVVGRLFLAFYKLTQLQAAKDIAAIPTEQKKELLKEYRAVVEELKWLQEQI